MTHIEKASRLLVVAAVAALALFAMPASAITDGTLDGNVHPAVVLILMEVDGVPAFRCSGTLIAPRYVLTAGHCAGAPSEFSGMRVFTESDVENGTNSYPYAGANSVEAVRWAAHPLYPTAPFFVHDVGMIKLAQAVVLDSSEYGTLPPVNSLDALKTKRGLAKQTFTSVGYGLQQINPVFIQKAKIRMVAHPRLIQINGGIVGGFSLLLSNNTSTGGTCFGDSGGPNFLGGDASRVVAAVTSFGLNGNCAGTGGVFRMDRQDVQDFVNTFKAE